MGSSYQFPTKATADYGSSFIDRFYPLLFGNNEDLIKAVRRGKDLISPGYMHTWELTESLQEFCKAIVFSVGSAIQRTAIVNRLISSTEIGLRMSTVGTIELIYGKKVDRMNSNPYTDRIYEAVNKMVRYYLDVNVVRIYMDLGFNYVAALSKDNVEDLQFRFKVFQFNGKYEAYVALTDIDPGFYDLDSDIGKYLSEKVRRYHRISNDWFLLSNFNNTVDVNQVVKKIVNCALTLKPERENNIYGTKMMLLSVDDKIILKDSIATRGIKEALHQLNVEYNLTANKYRVISSNGVTPALEGKIKSAISMINYMGDLPPLNSVKWGRELNPDSKMYITSSAIDGGFDAMLV